jgi:hypothetical protein
MCAAIRLACAAPASSSASSSAGLLLKFSAPSSIAPSSTPKNSPLAVGST